MEEPPLRNTDREHKDRDDVSRLEEATSSIECEFMVGYWARNGTYMHPGSEQFVNFLIELN